MIWLGDVRASAAGIRGRVSILSGFEPGSRFVIGFWALLALLYYLPYTFPHLSFVQIDDLLDHEVVHNSAVGRLWRGDATTLHAFLNGNISGFQLTRLTQPLSAIYALLPPLAAYCATDLVARAVAAIGAFLLTRKLGSPRLLAHLSAALFALSLANSAYVLSVAGLPLATYLLLGRRTPLNCLLLLFIGCNSSLYLVGLFFVLAAPVLHRFVFQRPIDREFLLGLASYGVGLLLGNAGLLWLAATSHVRWHREDWGVATYIPFPRPFAPVGPTMVFLLSVAAVVGWSDVRTRRILLFAAFVVAWFVLLNLEPAHVLQRKLPAPFSIAILDRFYFLWTLVVLMLVAFAARVASPRQQLVLIGAIFIEMAFSAVQHQQLRHFVRLAVGKTEQTPTFEEYYGFDWYRRRRLGPDVVVLSVGVPPMAAPINRVRSIDGYFQFYPLEYKRRFRRVIEKSLGPSGRQEEFDEWGSELRAFYPAGHPELINFCAASDLGANHVVSVEPIQSPNLELLASDGWLLYRVRDCPAARPVRPR